MEDHPLGDVYFERAKAFDTDSHEFAAYITIAGGLDFHRGNVLAVAREVQKE